MTFSVFRWRADQAAREPGVPAQVGQLPHPAAQMEHQRGQCLSLSLSYLFMQSETTFPTSGTDGPPASSVSFSFCQFLCLSVSLSWSLSVSVSFWLGLFLSRSLSVLLSLTLLTILNHPAPQMDTSLSLLCLSVSISRRIRIFSFRVQKYILFL